MSMQAYHIGLIKDGDRVQVQVVSEKDELDPELWQYYGLKETTKEYLKRRSRELLRAINDSHGTSFSRIEIL